MIGLVKPYVPGAGSLREGRGEVIVFIQKDLLLNRYHVSTGGWVSWIGSDRFNFEVGS